MQKLNVSSIIQDHFRSLAGADVVVMFLIPAAIASVLGLARQFPSPDMLIGLITAFSIFAALLFNLELLLFDLIRKDAANKADYTPRVTSRAKGLRETFQNISFEILVSVMAIISLVFGFLRPSRWGEAALVVGYFLMLIFGVNLVMILRRVHILIDDDARDLVEEAVRRSREPR